MAEIFCPVWDACGLVVHGNLRDVTTHLQGQPHFLRVSDPYPPGYRCRQAGCLAWYATYKGWKLHFRQQHAPLHDGHQAVDDPAPIVVDAGPAAEDGHAEDAMEVDAHEEDGQVPPAVPFPEELVQEVWGQGDQVQPAAFVEAVGADVGGGGHPLPGFVDFGVGQVLHAADDGEDHGGLEEEPLHEPALPAPQAGAPDQQHEHDAEQEGGVAGAEGHHDPAGEEHDQLQDDVADADGDSSGGSDEEDPSDHGSGSEDSAGEDGDPNDLVDMKQCAATMIVKLRSHATMNRTEVRLAMMGCESMLGAYSENVVHRVENFLRAQGLEDDPGAQELLESLPAGDPFRGFRSDKGQVAAAKRFYNFISPEKVDVGGRMDRVNVGNNRFRQIPVRESIQYVSVKDILKLIAGKQDVMDYVQNLRPRDDDMLTCYTDGDMYRNHPFFQRFPSAFQLSLYYDEFEVVNGEGSKVQIHTIAAFYFLIMNLPPHMNSSLENIHVTLLANYDDLKTLGFRRVLQPLLDDLAELESDAGVRVVVRGREHILRASLVAFEGDTKAAHEILEMLGPGARHFCRLCHISRAQMNTGVIAFGPRRTEELHLEHMAIVQANILNATLTGVRGTSVLHDLNHFRYWDNYVFDVFHDLVGVGHLVMRLVLRQFVCIDRYFRAVDLNRRIKAFQYGLMDVKNKPTANFSEESLNTALTSHNMKQHGAQTFCLLRALPFLLDGLVPENDPYLEWLNIFQDVVDFSVAPRVPRASLPLFRRHLDDYRRARHQLFPRVPKINKEHHIEHNPECHEKMGPLRAFMCMRPEGQHRRLKQHVYCAGSFRNAHMTAIESAQFFQASVWGTNSDTVIVKVKVHTAARDVIVEQMATRAILLQRGFADDDVLQMAARVSVYGTEYNVGEFVVVQSASQTGTGMPSFAQITGIVIANAGEDAWLEVQAWQTDGFDAQLHAFCISEVQDQATTLHDPCHLPLHPALSSWSDYTTDRTYMCMKYFVP